MQLLQVFQNQKCFFNQNITIKINITAIFISLCNESNLSDSIKKLKIHHHTELAFAKAIGLETNELDAFQDLLSLQNLSDLEIFEKFKHSY